MQADGCRDLDSRDSAARAVPNFESRVVLAASNEISGRLLKLLRRAPL
jgi:hypothetical protein